MSVDSSSMIQNLCPLVSWHKSSYKACEMTSNWQPWLRLAREEPKQITHHSEWALIFQIMHGHCQFLEWTNKLCPYEMNLALVIYRALPSLPIHKIIFRHSDHRIDSSRIFSWVSKKKWSCNTEVKTIKTNFRTWSNTNFARIICSNVCC